MILFSSCIRSQRTMNSLKRLAVTVLFRKKALGHTKVNTFGDVGLNYLRQVRNLTIFNKESRNFQCVGRRFYADLKKMKENPREDVTEDMHLDDEIDDIDEVDETYEEESTEEMFMELAAGNPEKLGKLKMLELELTLLRERQFKVPHTLSKRQWLDLCEIKTFAGRTRYLEFVLVNQRKAERGSEKSELRRRVYQMYREERGFHYYGLTGHTMLIRVYEKDLNKLLYHRLLTPKLDVILDCSYQKYMSPRNTSACAKQIAFCLRVLKNHRFRASLKLCNFDKNDNLGKILGRYISDVYERYSENIYHESYLDLYPKDKLVYLTPHTRNGLEKVDPNLVYIIGAFVDKGTSEKASVAKAKENGIRMARFPIDEYLLWKQGPKSLPLNMVLSILLDQAFYCDWYKSFKLVPSRCLEEDIW